MASSKWQQRRDERRERRAHDPRVQQRAEERRAVEAEQRRQWAIEHAARQAPADA